MEPYGASRYVDYSDGVPDMVKQFVVYFYRHIRCTSTPHSDTSLVAMPPSCYIRGPLYSTSHVLISV